MRTDLDKTRTENVALTEQVKVVTAKSAEAEAALAQLNTDLLAQKNSRAAAEQDAATLRTQLDTANTKLSALAQQRTAPAAEARALAAPDNAAPSAGDADLRAQLDTLRKQVWTLESERNDLQQKLTAIETAGKAPGLAEVKARAEAEARLTAALESAKMLRDENDQLKAGAAELAKSKGDLEAELAKARSAFPLAQQAQGLRDQLTQAQAQANSLIDENAKLKARLAVMAGPAGAGSPAPGTPPVTTPTPATGVTATLVTNVSGSAAAGATTAASAKARPTGAPLRFHTVTSGDTLSRISTLYYGTPTRWAEILVANKDVLGEDNNLVIGRTLRIP